MIEIRGGGRQSGRTTECIRWAAETGGYIICSTENEARRIAEQAREMGLNIKFPVSFNEMSLRGAYPTKVVIDNADWIIRHLIAPQHEIDFVTWETADDSTTEDDSSIQLSDEHGKASPPDC